MNKKIVITGGLGFIGSHTSIELSKDYDLIIIDNLYNSKKKVKGLIEKR